MKRKLLITIGLIILLSTLLSLPLLAADIEGESTRDTIVYKLTPDYQFSHQSFFVDIPYDCTFELEIQNLGDSLLYISILDEQNLVLLKESFIADSSRLVACQAGQIKIVLDYFKTSTETEYVVSLSIDNTDTETIQDLDVPLAKSPPIVGSQYTIPFPLAWGCLGFGVCLACLIDYFRKNNNKKR